MVFICAFGFFHFFFYLDRWSISCRQLSILWSYLDITLLSSYFLGSFRGAFFHYHRASFTLPLRGKEREAPLSYPTFQSSISRSNSVGEYRKELMVSYDLQSNLRE